MIDDLVKGIASNVLYDVGKRALRESEGFCGRLKTFFSRQKAQMVFIPEAVGITVPEATTRKLIVRLVLLGSPNWMKDQEVLMEPDFSATLIPPGNGQYQFAKSDLFSTVKVPKGMHAYFIGEQALKPEHLFVNPLSRHGVLFNGHIEVERIGKIPIFPLALLANYFGEGGGFRNEPLESNAIRKGVPS